MLKCLLTSDTHYGHTHKTHKRHEKFFEQIKKEDFDLLIHAGDWSSSRQDQFRRTMAMFRRELGDDVPILAVRGNHDFWDFKKGGRKMQRKYFLPELMRMHDEWFDEYNITYLGRSMYQQDDVVFVGFDGWYGSSNPPTNDGHFMIRDVEGCPTMTYMANKAHKDLDLLLQRDYSKFRKSVCVSHFPPFSGDWKGKGFSANFSFFQPMKDKFDVLCFGHSHRRVDREEDGTKIYNCGSDYDKPNYIIFEV